MRLSNTLHDVKKGMGVIKLLMEKGPLAEEGMVPNATNEEMYEFRNGYRPFWIKG